MSKTFEQLFRDLPYSQIDIKHEISSNGLNIEVGWVIEGYDEWGNKIHLSSGITGSFDLSLELAKKDLESKIGLVLS